MVRQLMQPSTKLSPCQYISQNTDCVSPTILSSVEIPLFLYILATH